MEPDGLTSAIVDSLRHVIDPCCRERGISVIDMGLLHDVDVDEDGHATVEIMLTSGWCPFQVDLVSEIEAAVADVPEVVSAAVSITLDEAWSTARLSLDAAAKLQFLPAPSEVHDRSAWAHQRLPVVPSPTTTPVSS